MVSRMRVGSCDAARRVARLMTTVWALGVFGSALAARPAAGAEAYTVRQGNLVVLDLGTGDVTVAGATGLIMGALARSPAGELYAAARQPGAPENPWQLWTLDPATGAPTLEGALGDIPPPGDLAFDAAGSLWLAAGGDLYAVDPASGAATPVGPPGGSLEALAALGGELYGIEAAAPPGWQLVRVDRTSGATVPIAPLSGLGIVLYLVMDFDAAGRLWILAVEVPPIMSPPFTLVYRAADPLSGEVESVFGFGEVVYEGLAIAAPVVALDIPVLDRRGLLLLVGLLVVAAFRGLRRRGAAELRPLAGG